MLTDSRYPCNDLMHRRGQIIEIGILFIKIQKGLSCIQKKDIARSIFAALSIVDALEIMNLFVLGWGKFELY